jgi:chemotaxis protein methyltransferase CheR
MHDLGLDDYSAYRARLETDPSEWRALDECCHITISRFFRDRGIFEVVRRRVLPDIAMRAKREGRNAQIWSAGCASGEEPYTLKILWDIEVASAFPGVSLSIVATDVDQTMLARAREGCFEPTSLHELPPPLIERGFDRLESRYCVKAIHRQGIEIIDQDLRSATPSRDFDLILCRYVAFTYFSEPLQRKVLASMLERLRPQGYLVIGTHEKLPGEVAGLAAVDLAPQIFQKIAAIERH